jgi:hypothetical protein
MSNGILTIKAAVKSVLADASLSQVSKWLSAEPPPSAYPGLCFGWVEWSGGPNAQANFDRKKAVDEFFIVIITKNADADQAESDGLSLAEKAEALLSADRKLGGAVTDSLVTLREKQKVFDGKFSVNAVRLTLQTWRWMTS